MSDIDPEKLEEAIKVLRGWWCHGLSQKFDASDKAKIDLVCQAAEVTLATLPRFKEVEIVQWAVVAEGGGDVVAVYDDDKKGLAESHAADVRGRTVVRLTGTAKVKVNP